jgi:hypothetical protein
MPTKAVIGFKSSMIASILALLMLTLPLLAGNYLDKTRSGQGKFGFSGDICYDTNIETDFDNDYKVALSTGKGAMAYSYYDGVTSSTENNKITMQSIAINGTIDNVAVGTTNPNPGDIPVPNPAKPNLLTYQMNFTKNKILDFDIVRIDIYLDIGGVAFSNLEFNMGDQLTSVKVFTGTKINIGNLTKIDVKVSDLLKINTLSDTGKILLSFTTQNSSGIV